LHTHFSCQTFRDSLSASVSGGKKRDPAKKILLQKLNVVIGTFFSEVGLELLRRFNEFVVSAGQLEGDLLIDRHWDKKKFREAQSRAASFKYNIVIDMKRLEELRDFLKQKHSFLVRLLENPILLEHQHFTDLL
jgi:hypothetical protein